MPAARPILLLLAFAGCTPDDGPTKSNSTPVATLVSPEGNGAYYADIPVEIAATVSDAEDAADELTLAWTDADGAPLSLSATPDADGAVSDSVALVAGDYTFVLEVVDTTGSKGTARVDFSVLAANLPPTCAIVSPADGATGELGVSASFVAALADPDAPPERLAAAWASDRDGALGATNVGTDGATALDLDALSLGTHVVSVTATDEGGATCAAAILFTVGIPPEGTIDAPLDGDLVNEGDTVTFSATVFDAATAPERLGLSWESDRDGVIDVTGADAAGLATFDIATLSAGDHTVTLTTTDADGLYARASVALTVNALPTAPGVSILPATPGTDDDLVATIATASSDLEGDAITYAWAWYADGVRSAWTADTVPASATARGELWQVVVTPNDGWGDGLAGGASATIENGAPVLAGVTLSPDPVAEGGLLACTPDTAADPDGDTVSFRFAWTVDGVPVPATAATLGDEWWARGQTVVCSVTPDDGATAGAAVASNAVTVGNAAPTLAAVDITPDPADAADTLTCTATGYADADGDADATTYAWFVDGVSVGTGTTLSGVFGGGDTVTCTATPHDGTDAGTALSDGVTIANSAPVLASVSLTPTTATVASTLTCTPGSATDADGDTLSYAWSWYVDGGLIAPVSATLTGPYFAKGNSVHCSVTASDGTASSAATSSSAVTVSNTAPVTSAVTLSPTLVYTSDTLTATPTSTDADGDTVSHAYAWYVNGTPVGATSSTLPGTTYFSKGDTVYVRVTPTDGATAGTAVSSGTTTIGNTAPTAPTVSIDPEDPEEGLDPLVCSVTTASTDVDGDSVTYAFTWTQNGAAYTGDSDTSTTSTVPAAAVTADDVFICTATPSDGTGSGTADTETVTVLGASYTIGYSSVFAAPGTGSAAANYSLGQAITVSSAVDLYQLGAYLRLADADSIRMALYTDSGSAPGTLVAYTALTSLGAYASGSAVELDVVGGPVPVPAGTYWIMQNLSGTAYMGYTTVGASSNTIYYNALPSSTAFPSSWGSGSTYTGNFLNLYMIVR